MNARSQVGVRGDGRRSTLSVSETFWGYIVYETAERFDRESVAEGVLRFLGLILILSAYGQWLIPGSILTDDVIVMKLAISVIFVVFGIALYWFANRGFRTEWQIDASRREIRMATRNGRGNSKLVSRIPMSDVESAFVKRGQTQSHMFFRLRGVPDPMHVLSGSEADLRDFYERLRHDMRPPRDRVEARMAMTGQVQPKPVRPRRPATA
ncbi:MAG: hypothetical protein HRU32_15295 [Rhodobacteraceae bacterium]|nr:hypothetical protein [Paracoccaceae bacterium]